MTRNPLRHNDCVPNFCFKWVQKRLHFPASLEAGWPVVWLYSGQWDVGNHDKNSLPLHLALKAFQDTFLSLPYCNDAGVAPHSHLNPRSFTEERIKSWEFSKIWRNQLKAVSIHPWNTKEKTNSLSSCRPVNVTGLGRGGKDCLDLAIPGSQAKWEEWAEALGVDAPLSRQQELDKDSDRREGRPPATRTIPIPGCSLTPHQGLWSS